MRILLTLLAALLTACATPQLPGTAGAPTLAVSAEQLLVVTLRNPLAPGLHGAGSTWRGWDWGGQYRRSATVERAADELAQAYGLRQIDAWPIRVLDVHCVVFALAAAQSRESVLQQLAADQRVESAQPLQQFQSLGGSGYNDSQRDLQLSLGAMQLEQAHRWSQGRGVRVAVVDTGVDSTHPDLKGRVRAEHDFVALRGALPHSERHGTAVAGIIGARAGNAEGIVGVAPQAEMYALKACWPLAPGSSEASCNSFTLARALAAAVDLQADVLNLSLSGPADPLLARMVKAAVARGMLVVGAVPDSWTRGRDEIFPASIAGVIAVRVAGTPGVMQDMVAAPGKDILVPVPGAAYEFQSGSSMAAAHITGVAALLREQRPRLTPAQLEKTLMQSIGTDSPDGGSINACIALARLLNRQGCAPESPAPL